VSTEKATFGAGCFWGVESAFRDIPGVIDAAVGYEGGTMVNPRYEDVCTDETGHAEVVELTFDPAKVSYEKLVEAFFGLHNPTTLNRQGPDVGNQYRSVIFFHSPEQERVAREVLQRAQPRFQKPIVTKVEPAQTFYKAEDYHQQYLAKRGLKHCHI
jgi:peptide-methionine (S)-S-oxide reductase